MEPLEDRLTGMSEAQLRQELLNKFKIIGNTQAQKQTNKNYYTKSSSGVNATGKQSQENSKIE